MINEIRNYINSLCGIQISNEDIELIDGDFRTGILKVKLSINVDNHHLIKDKLIKDKYCSLMDTAFKFIDDTRYECLVRIDYNGLNQQLNKPAITNICDVNNV